MCSCGVERRKSLRTCVGQKIHSSGLKVRREAAEVVRGCLLPMQKLFSCVASCLEPRAQFIQRALEIEGVKQRNDQSRSRF